MARWYNNGKKRITDARNFSDAYKDYMGKLDTYDLESISNIMFYDICGDFYKEIKQEILNGREFKLPFGLGNIVIGKIKRNTPSTRMISIDWKKTKEVGYYVRHLNEHSNNYYYKIKWTPKLNGVKNNKIYMFEPARDFKRTLSKLIQNKEQDYYEFEN